MRGLQVAVTVVGLLFLIGVSYPLLAFVTDLYEGSNSGIFMRAEGDTIVITFDYRGEVQLTDVVLSICFRGPEREVNRSASAEVMGNGSSLIMRIPAEQLPTKLTQIGLTLKAKVGGLFPLTVTRVVNVEEGS